ncbi:hypothetical protein ACLOJK_016184 [Asimina triloba]
MKRTTSMNEFSLDISAVQASNDPQNHPSGPARNQAAFGSTGFDPRFSSPGNQKRSSASDFLETAHFMRACGLCKRRLGPGRDIYMYRGDSAFCSLECRQEQMNHDERKEKCSWASMMKKKEAPSAVVVGSDASTAAHETVASAY